MIVVDTNILVTFHLKGAESELAREAARRDKWCVPYLWRSEFCSAVIRLHRAKMLPYALGTAHFQSSLRLIAGREYLVDGEQVIDCAAGSAASAYDCEFVVLADKLGLKLVTLDQPLIKHFPATAVHLRDYLADTSLN